MQRVWYERRPFALFLLLMPLSLLFALLAMLRRALYRVGALRAVKVARPVLVIGNVSVGGTGKTPLVIWLAERIANRGYRVGIVTRGYGGTADQWPQDVAPDSATEQVGDEAVLLATRTSAIVVAGPDRVAAAMRAIERGAQIILSDDGLQHYRLARDAEIVVIDAHRRFGNGWLLPAGPLRESPRRAQRADLIVESARGGRSAASTAHLVCVQSLEAAVNLRTGERRALTNFADTPAHAVAAIGHPDAFFAMLRERGVTATSHAFPDHAPLNADDLQFGDEAPVLMTEKDAVKCRAFASERFWAVPLGVAFDAAHERRLDELIDRLIRLASTSTDRGDLS